MSHITYNEFKNRFGDLGITKYTKAMWLEEGCEEIGKIRLGIDVICTKNDTAPETGTRYTATMPNDTELSTDIRTAKGLYGQSFNTVYDGRTYNDTRPYDLYLGGGNATIYIHLPASWTEDQCQAYLKDKVILYKKKGYYAFTFDRISSSQSIPFDTTKPLTVTLLERTVISKGDAVDSGKIGIAPNNGDGYGIKQGQSHTWTLPYTGTYNGLLLYANDYNYGQSLDYTVKVRIKVEQ